jgi:hypothetical protein
VGNAGEPAQDESHDGSRRDVPSDTAPLASDRDGDQVRLSGSAQDLEELSQVVTAASADPEVEEVDVADVEVDQPDSGLWR